MKTFKISILSLIFASALTACGGSEAVEAGDKQDVSEATGTAVTYTVDTAASVLNWHGEKLAYGHDGTIKILSGTLALEGGNLTSGNFEVDMKSIKETGEGVDPEMAAKLEGHLMNEDFFNSEVYPIAKFEITKADKKSDTEYAISGNLTIKDSTKNINFPATIVVDDMGLDAKAEFTINRLDWGIVYGSGLSGALGDKVISNDIKFKVALRANK